MDFLRKTHTVVPFLVAMFAAVAGMPTNVFQVCRRSVGTLEVEPWLNRSRAVTRAIESVSNWMLALMRLHGPAACAAAVMLALMVADLSASHSHLAMAGVLGAIVPVASISSLDALRTERVQLVREAEALSGPDAKFETDAARADGDKARTNFDAKMARVREIDARIGELERTPAPPATDAAAARAQGAVDERERIKGIGDAVRIAGLGAELGADMIGRGLSMDAARAEIFIKLAEKDAKNPTQSRVQPGEDADDKRARGLANWLLVRSGAAAAVAKHEGVELKTIDPGEFRGMSLLDMAKETLERAGITARGLSKMDLAGKAMTYRSGGNYQTPSDFTVVLENVMHKILRAAYGLTPDTWTRFCATGTTSDFRTHNFYRTGFLSELDSLSDTGEFKNKAIPDGEKATYSVGTKGNIIAISRQTIVNDDMGAVMQLTQRLGRAGKLTIEKMVYALLAQNAGLGPTYAGTTLFHATKNNISTGAALSAAAIDADRVAMASQMEPNSNEYADLRPAILLLPVSLGGQARVINMSQYDPDTLANKSQMKPNVVAGLFRDVVDTPRITGTRRYLFADPSIAPVIMVSFLEGQQEPVLETENGWRVDGVEMKARLDVGVDAVDYRGAITNAGV
jgi:hypothetical protein